MRIRTVLAAVLASVGIGLLGTPGSARAAADAEQAAKCMKCHDEDHARMARSAHATRADPAAPNCVSCHGASEQHIARKGRVPADLSFGRQGMEPAARSNVCLACHDKGARQMLWAGSAHPNADVACTSCHTLHTNRDRALMKATEPDVCYACHKEQRVGAALPSRHPTAEGKVVCSDCHNVHGSAGPKLARRDSTNATCYACHADKRGPFVHQHEPVVEDCAICHAPHGSAIPGMLKARAPFLCNQCHTPHTAADIGALGGQPGVFGGAVTGTSNGKNPVSMFQGRSCMNCHTQVHGSNNPAVSVPAPQLMFR